MTDDREAKLRAYPEKAAGSLASAKERIRDLEARSSEPIAVVSMACRLPVLGWSSGANVPPDALLSDYGLRSPAAVELAMRWQRHVGSSLPATFAFRHPRARRIARAPIETMENASPSIAVAATTTSTASALEHPIGTRSTGPSESIAISRAMSDDDLFASIDALVDSHRSPISSL